MDNCSTSPIKKRLRIGVPNLSIPVGPKIFLSRLIKSIEAQNLAKSVSFLSPFYNIGLFNSISRSYYRKPYVLRLDGIGIDAQETIGPNKKINKKISRSIIKSSGVVYQSFFTKELIEKNLGIEKTPFIIIGNGVDLNHFSSSGNNYRSQLKIPADDIVMLTSASWRAHKRLDDIIEIFFVLEKMGFKNIHLLIIGTGHKDIPKHDRIHCSGLVHHENLPAWYRTGDFFIYLSWLDNCPNTVVEAVSSGLPVICSNQGGTREIIERANAGIIVDADQPYHFGLVDLYNPPKPDYKKIIDAILEIKKNLSGYKHNIDYKGVDISVIARSYYRFLESCV
jgi:glycosyltransferase involved in cell wall biosynthesis